jgi:hypothetical protein
LSKIYCINGVIALKAALSNLDGECGYKVAYEAPALQGSLNNLDKRAISLIIGSLLGFSYMEKHGLGFRIVFIKLSNNVEYLRNFHSFFAKNGYCSFKKPVLYKFISKGNKVLFLYRFKTYTFSNFDWLFNMFYKNNAPSQASQASQGLHKRIPHNLNNYFTPLALATLFIPISQLRLSLKTKDDGLACEAVALYINYKNEDLPKKFKLETIASIDDLKYLSFLLKNKYNIDTVIKFSGLENANNFKGSLYIKNSSISSFSKLVKPHFLDSQSNLLNTSIEGKFNFLFFFWACRASLLFLIDIFYID